MKQLLVLFLVVTLFLAGSFGMSIIMHSVSGEMPGCPLMDGGSICSMDIAGHLSQWHSLFLATIPSDGMLMLAAMFSSIAFAVSIFLAFRNPHSLDDGVVFFRSQLHRYAQETLHSHFVALFSSGILHPKRYG